MSSDTVEVEIPYEDQYTFREKQSEICDNIPDTENAHRTFGYCPYVKITFLWNKDSGDLKPKEITIDGEEYKIVRKSGDTIFVPSSVDPDCPRVDLPEGFGKD